MGDARVIWRGGTKPVAKLQLTKRPEKGKRRTQGGVPLDRKYWRRLRRSRGRKLPGRRLNRNLGRERIGETANGT